MKPHLRKMWVIPPAQRGTFVAHMEDILELYHTPYDPRSPWYAWMNNIAEIELSALTLQYLDRRMPDIATLRGETKPWEQRRNASQKGVDWQFSTHDARIKLKRLYPQIQS